MLTDDCDHATVCASSKCWLLKLDRQAFRQVIMTHPQVLAFLTELGYLDDDDHLRGEVIQQLICNNTLDKRRIESQFGIDFNRYFATELAQLADMHADELVELGEQRLDVTARGRLLIRNICRVFDRYRVDKEEKFSKMI